MSGMREDKVPALKLTVIQYVIVAVLAATTWVTTWVVWAGFDEGC